MYAMLMIQKKKKTIVKNIFTLLTYLNTLNPQRSSCYFCSSFILYMGPNVIFYIRGISIYIIKYLFINISYITG